MELYQLRYFQAVADTGTLRKAAEHLSVSQSAVSRAVSMLEAEIGVDLFTRRGRVNELNRFGREFLAASRTARRTLDAAVDGVRQLAGADEGTVAVGFLHSLGVATVPDLIRRHHKRFPQARFTLRQRSGHALLGDLVDGATDICLSHPAAFSVPPGMQWHTLFTERLYAVVDPAHRFAKREAVSFGELASEPVVVLDGDHTLRAIFDDACSRHHVTATIAFEGSDIATLRGLVAARLGIAVLPRSPVRDSEIVEIAIDDDELVRPIAIGWMADRYLPPAAVAFRETALAVSAECQAGSDVGVAPGRVRPPPNGMPSGAIACDHGPKSRRR